jgi:hypothetical protein
MIRRRKEGFTYNENDQVGREGQNREEWRQIVEEAKAHPGL